MVAIAAAAVGRLVSLPLALVGGLGLGIFIALFDTFLPRWSDDYTFLEPIQDNITPAHPVRGPLRRARAVDPAIGGAREVTDPLSGVDPPPPSLAAESRSASTSPGPRGSSRVVFFSVVGYRRVHPGRRPSGCSSSPRR